MVGAPASTRPAKRCTASYRNRSKARSSGAACSTACASHVVIAHVREATVGDRRADNTQPFRMRQWLFAHVGEVAGFAAMRERLVESLPDFLRRNMRGQTDSELLFHVLLSFLHDSGQLDSVDIERRGGRLGALRSTVTLIDRYAREVGAGPGSLTLALTNGRQLYALRRGSPLCLVQRDSLAPRAGSDPGDPSRPRSRRCAT